MISIRYLYFAIYYIIINYTIAKLDELTIDSMFSLFTSTSIFFYIIKFTENKNKPDSNELETKSVISLSVIYGLLSLSIKYIYDIFLNVESVYTFLPFINTTYIFEAFFISGGLLFINQLVIMIYPQL